VFYQRTILYRVLDTFIRRRRLFFVVTSIIIGIVVVFALTRPAKYSATYTIVYSPSPAQNPLGTEAEPAWTVLPHAVNEIQRLLLTKDFLRSVLTTPDGKPLFLHVPINFNSLEEISTIQEGAVVSTDNIESFTIEFTYPNADDTLAILNGIIYAYITWDEDHKTAFLTQQVAFLKEQVNDYKGRLDLAEANLVNWKKSHLSGDPANMAGNQQNLENLNDRRAQLQFQLESAQVRTTFLKEQLASTPKYIIANERLNAGPETPLQTRLNQLETELVDDTYVKGMTEDHPVVVALKIQIGRLKAAVGNQNRQLSPTTTPGLDINGTRDLQPNQTYTTLQNDLLQTQIDMRSLTTEIGDTDNRAVAAKVVVAHDPDYERQLAELTRKYKIYDQYYNLLNDHLEQAKINEQANRRQVLDQYAVMLTQEPTSSNKGKKAALVYVGGVALAIFMGLGLVIAAEVLDGSLRYANDIQIALGTPLLAVIPEVSVLAHGERNGAPLSKSGRRKPQKEAGNGRSR